MSRRRWVARLLVPVFCLTLTWSVGTAAPRDDPEFARLVHEWTTRPDFISPLVDHLPKVDGVPSPKDVLGYHIGQPQKLTYYSDILRYYRTKPRFYPNGRRPIEDIYSYRWAWLTYGKMPATGLIPHADLLTDFPYLGPPNP